MIFGNFTENRNASVRIPCARKICVAGTFLYIPLELLKFVRRLLRLKHEMSGVIELQTVQLVLQVVLMILYRLELL